MLHMNRWWKKISWHYLYPHQVTWAMVRLTMLVITGLVIVGLFVDARFEILNGLSIREIFWMVLMPVVVVMIYLSPMLWRNICPLSTVSLWHFSLFGRRKLCQNKLSAHQCSVPMKKAHTFLRTKGLVVSAILFWSIVPARLFLFNASSSATFWMLVILFASAFVMGFLFPVKSGWCTSICPMSAIEKTYGLNPAISFNNTRCHFYSEANKRVLSCSGCSLNCGDVVNPEHAYWQADNNKLFHDTMNARMRKIFLATLPAFLLSFYFIGNGIITLPDGSIWQQAIFVYSFFAFMMLCSGTLYMHLKNILREKVEQKEGVLHIEQPSVLYAMYKRRLDLSFVMVIMNIIWVSSSYAIMYKIVGRIFPSVSESILLVTWVVLIMMFFSVTLFSVRNGWNETLESGRYKPSWW